MQKRVNVITAALFVAAFMLNFSFNSKGEFSLLKTANANVPVTYKGPSNWYCYTNGQISSTLIVCTDEGSVDCYPTTPCP